MEFMNIVEGFALVLFPTAEPDIRTWKWVVYLGGNPGRQNEGVGKMTPGRRKSQQREQ